MGKDFTYPGYLFWVIGEMQGWYRMHGNSVRYASTTE